MPAKKRLVPPIRPNADGTGFVRAGRPGAPARNRSGGPRRAQTPSDSSAASSQASRSSSEEAAAPTSSSAPSRGRQGRAAEAPQLRAAAKPAATSASAVAAASFEASGKPCEPNAQLKEATAASSSVSRASQSRPQAPPQPSPQPAVPVKNASKTSSQPPAATTAAAPRSKGTLQEVDVGVDGALGPSECLLPARLLHQLGLLNGSLVLLSTQYGDVYAEARQLRSTAAVDRVLVSEDAAAVLVDKRARLSPLPPPQQSRGLPVLTSVTLKAVTPEGVDGAASATATAATLSSTLEWQAMFRRLLHHKIAYLHMRTTQRVLTQRLALEVASLTTAEASAAPSVWGVVTDATLLYLEGGQTTSEAAAAPSLASAATATTSASAPHSPLCTLVVGESGTGKSRLLRQLSGSTATTMGGQSTLAEVTPASSQLPSSAERRVEWVRVEELPQGEGSEVGTATVLRESFERARLSAPSLVLLDDLHLICARETTSAGSRWAMSLIAHALAEELLDLQRRAQDVRVVASAPSLDSLDGCLTSTSLFGQGVVTLEMPSGAAERLTCLRSCLQEVSGAASLAGVTETCLAEVAQRAHGFTQRDLHRLAETAVVKAFHARQSVVPADADLRAAAAVVHPSSLKRFEVTVPNVTWDDIGGSAEAKQTLCDVVEWCLGKQRWIFTDFNLTPPKGVLLYGPPGCSKTMLAKALANESHMNFISVKGPEVFSKWVGDSEKAVRDIFERARAASPCVVFIDELDGMCGHRGRGGVSDRVISQFLTELDGLPAAFEEKKNALVFVAATNRPDSIDGAVLRPGRIDRRVYVGLPSYEERVAITAIQFRSIPVAADLTAEYVAAHTEGYTGAEVVAVVKEAAFHAITADERAACVTLADVDAALEKVRPRIRPVDVEWYKQWPHNTPVKAD